MPVSNTAITNRQVEMIVAAILTLKVADLVTPEKVAQEYGKVLTALYNARPSPQLKA